MRGSRLRLRNKTTSALKETAHLRTSKNGICPGQLVEISDETKGSTRASWLRLFSDQHGSAITLAFYFGSRRRLLIIAICKGTTDGNGKGAVIVPTLPHINVPSRKSPGAVFRSRGLREKEGCRCCVVAVGLVGWRLKGEQDCRDMPRCRKCSKAPRPPNPHVPYRIGVSNWPLAIHTSVTSVSFPTSFLTTTVALGQTGRQPGWVFWITHVDSSVPMLWSVNAPDRSSIDVKNYLKRRSSYGLAPHVYKIKIRISVL
jgi:hypothetical protein